MSTPVKHNVARIRAGAIIGVDAAPIEVETDLRTGLPGMQIVGMGNKAIDEARQRVRSAVTNTGLSFPAQKITVNLAPAELPKDGSYLDLPIALSILVASGQLTATEVADTLFAGELALDGSLRPIRGVIPLAELALKSGAKRLIIPAENLAQARLAYGVEAIGVSRLDELYGALKGVRSFPLVAATSPPQTATQATPVIDDVHGQAHAKRALIIAAAGRHNILFSGPPGTGKTLLASCLASLLPPLSPQEIIEVTKLHSLASGSETGIHTQPPIRSPHHSVSISAFIGGGLRLRPGELSLAHRGILLLDEIAEYPRHILESLRQPLESRTIHLARLYDHASYPADVLLAATMNPCPCGYAGSARTPCTCSPPQISAYTKRLSGPLLDRIDLRVAVHSSNQEHIFSSKALKKPQHTKVLLSIKSARKAQAKRYNRSDYYNSFATPKQAKQLFQAMPQALDILHKAAARLALSSRSSLRVLRVARTIADLDNSPSITPAHMAEALQYR